VAAITEHAQGGDGSSGAPTRGPAGVPWWAILLTLGLAATSIFALLADLYDITTMATFTRWVTLPGLTGLVVLAVAPIEGLEELRKRIRVGAVGGLVGTAGYDLFRIPFVLAGRRLLAPIDSYGLLISGQVQSSTLTGTYGWLFHLSNGVTFGIMYAVVAARRSEWWGVGWAMVLETATLVTPFRDRYALNGMVATITISYAAHLFYGYPLGRLVRDMDKTDAQMRSVTPKAPAILLVLSVITIVVWLRPWSRSPARREAGRLSRELHQPVAVVERDRFIPEWLAVKRGGCVTVVNHSSTTFTTRHGTVPAGGTGRLCFDQAGVQRVKLGTDAYTGGFVYVRSRGV
jgi:hypothetical protein